MALAEADSTSVDHGYIVVPFIFKSLCKSCPQGAARVDQTFNKLENSKMKKYVTV
jgi:hypothetical protein